MEENSKGYPIYLGSGTILMVHLFHREDNLEDLWMYDVDSYREPRYMTEKASPRVLMNKISDYCTPKFLYGLRTECERLLTEWQPDWKERFK